MVKKAGKTRGLVFVIALALFAAACPADSNEPGSNTPQPGGDGSEPVTGNADTESADAVIILKGATAEYTGANVNIVTSNVYGTIVEITGNGTYVIQGTLNQGFVAVSKRDIDVTIILNGVHIYCGNYAALTCLKKSNVTLVLAENSVNYLTDGGEGAVDGKYPLGYDSEEQPNAALLIRADLTIKGPGKLTVNGNANNGIGSRANLAIEGGDITVSAAKNALKGNDSIAISGGKFNLTADKDAIITEEIDGGLGAINISGGDFTINAMNDAVQAATSLTISNAVFKIKTGRGSGVSAGEDSAKGLKAGTDITVHSGTFDIDSNDDSIHSNGTVTINGGTFTISSADDGIHADERLTINGGTISINKCYEGLEALNIDLNGGFVKIKASDDGINIAGGRDSSTTNPGGGWGRPPGGGMPGAQAIDGTLSISGGEYRIESTGDGLDSNGNISMDGGTLVIYGPSSGVELPIDYDGNFVMSGGLLVALGNYGSSGMPAQQPGSSSTQYTFRVRFQSAVPANSLINVSSSSGEEVVTVRALGSTSSMVVCSPLLKQGTYAISWGGAYSGAANELGLYEGGTYSGGNAARSITLSAIVSTPTVN